MLQSNIHNIFVMAELSLVWETGDKAGKQDRDQTSTGFTCIAKLFGLDNP